VTVRYPLAHRDAAETAADLLGTVMTVVERYLGARWQGRLRLDLLEDARASGANPAAAIVRHALRGFEVRSPATAGVLSYQVGQIAWYATTRERDYLGPPPRVPDWLVEAALLPLTHVWSGRESWLDHVAAHARRVLRSRPLEEAALEDHRSLEPRARALAVSTSLLRGRSLQGRHPDWVVEVVNALARRPEATGIEALEAVTGVDRVTHLARFARDLDAWRSTDDEWREGP
jgi:hypothetical protein